MTSREDLRNLCRRRLGDLGDPFEFSNLQINQWINDAIAEYSIYFPRESSLLISLVEGQSAYSLENVRRVVAVSYPASADPPVYLQRGDHRLGEGFYGTPRYDVLGEPPTSLILGPAVRSGEQVEVRVLGDHDYPAADATPLTVPDRHLELLVLFVRLAAAQEIASQEMMDPQVTTLLSSTLSTNAGRAGREYRLKLKEYLQAESLGGQPLAWGWDEHGRLY